MDPNQADCYFAKKQFFNKEKKSRTCNFVQLLLFKNNHEPPLKHATFLWELSGFYGNYMGNLQID